MLLLSITADRGPPSQPEGIPNLRRKNRLGVSTYGLPQELPYWQVDMVPKSGRK